MIDYDKICFFLLCDTTNNWKIYEIRWVSFNIFEVVALELLNMVVDFEYSVF